MSVVTNLMLACSSLEHDYLEGGERRLCKALQHVADWCNGVGKDPDRDHIRFPDSTVDAVSAGTKHMECRVYAWGANYLDLDGFLEAVRTAPWRQPECVQVFVQGQDDDVFSVFMLADDRMSWRVYAPKP